MSTGNLNIMIMGEIGVGKSSVVNLIAGKAIAEISPDSKPCTVNTTRHCTSAGPISVNIWEVAGFNQPKDSNVDIDLGPVLADSTAAVDAVLFCMRAGRPTATTTTFFKFVRTLFGEEVPIVLVMTFLERNGLESWWRQSEKCLSGMGVKGTDHVCVTGLQEERWERERKDSQEALLNVLKGIHATSKNKSLESIFLRYLYSGLNLQEKKLKVTLMKRYNLDEPTVQRLLVNWAPPRSPSIKKPWRPW